jgi:hypothetical protein
MSATNLPPDPDGMNNDRAAWAELAIDALGAATNMVTAGESRETMLGDLLADLMHWCDRNGVDFNFKLEGARMNYEEETRDE